MKLTKLIIAAFASAALFSLTACGAADGQNIGEPTATKGPQIDDNRMTIKEDDKTITILDNKEDTAAPSVTVQNIDPYEGMEICDWINETTLIISKPNESLPKMSLSELADTYPRSLYLYHLDTDELELLEAEEDLNLGGATLSPDKKHLLYSANSLGDPTYRIMNLDSKEVYTLYEASSAHWANDGTVIGQSYTVGAYIADTSGQITSIVGLPEQEYFTIEKINGSYYLNTTPVSVIDIASGRQHTIEAGYVTAIIPSPDQSKILLIQSDDTKMSMLLSDASGENSEILAEGAGISSVAWSPDGQMIAFWMMADANGATPGGVYVYDLLTGGTTQIAVGMDYALISWSPSSRDFAYADWDDAQYNSSIIHLNYSIAQ